MTTSVVIVSYRPDEWLVRAISSVAEQADDIVVVDNASPGAAATSMAVAAGVRVVSASKNLGFAGGASLGLEHCRGDVVALLNDDAVAGAGWLQAAAALLDAETNVGAVGPKILLQQRYAVVEFDDETWFSPGDPRPLGRQLHTITVDGADVLAGVLGGVHRVETDGTATWRWTYGRDEIYVPLPEGGEADVAVDGEPVELRRVVDLVNSAGTYLSREGFGGDVGSDTPDVGQFDDRRSRFGVCGAAFVTTRNVLGRVGRFAPHYFAYYEDLDWSWRVRRAGYDVVYDPATVVRHRRGATSGGESTRATRRLAALNRLETLARNAPMRVVRRELRRATASDAPVPVGRDAPVRVARGLIARPRLRSRSAVTVDDVWTRWAGVDETWTHPGRRTDAPPVPPVLRFDE